MDNLTRYEMETVVNYNEEQRTASVYTHNNRLIHKLMDSCKRFPDLFKLEQEQGQAKTFIIPKKYISIRQPKIMTAEQKQQAQERMSTMRSKIGLVGEDIQANIEGEKAG